MTDLAKLVVRLEAQTAQYQANLEKAQKQLATFDGQASVSAANIRRGLVTAAVAAATAFGVIAKAAVDNADKIFKLSQATGITTESLSQLEHAAELSDISLDELAKASARLSKNTVEAAKGSKAQKEAFDALGVSVEDAEGKMRSTEDILLDVADRFAKLEDGAAKAALAQELFGKSGTRLIPFLNQGRAGIEALKDEAEALGLTITQNTGAAAEQFNDNLTRLGAAVRGVTNQVVEKMLPTFTALSEKWVQSAKAGGALNAAAVLLAGGLKVLVTAGVIITSIFQQLGQIIYGVGAALVRVAQGEFALAAQEIQDAFAKAQSNVTDDMETIAQIWSDVPAKIEGPAKEIDDILEDTILFNDTKAGDEAKKAAEAALEQIQTLATGLQQQVDTFGAAESAVIRYRIAQGDLAQTIATAGESAGPFVEQIIAMTDSLEALQLKTDLAKQRQDEFNAIWSEAQNIAESVRTPAESYGDTIERLNELLAAGALTQDTYNRAVAQAQEAFDKALEGENVFRKRATENVQDAIADALINGAEKGARGVLKTFVDMLLKMQAQALAANIAKAIFGGGGVGSGGGFAGFAVGLLGGGSRDSGGRGEPGKEYMIGTGAQPERFVPDRPGTFIPASDMRPQVTLRPQILNLRDPSEIPTALESSEGEQAIINVVARNPSVIRNLLQG